MLGDAMQALLQVVSFQRGADLPDQAFFMTFQVHAEVADFGYVMIVH